jgi:type II secretory pathway component GspD/PulD (secretin)
MTAPRAYHTSTALRNGDVVVIGGYNGSSSLTSMDYYEVASNTWSSVAQKTLTQERSMNTSLMLTNGKVLTLGSYCPVPSGACTTYTSSEIWAP